MTIHTLLYFCILSGSILLYQTVCIRDTLSNDHPSLISLILGQSWLCWRIDGLCIQVLSKTPFIKILSLDVWSSQVCERQQGY